MSEEEEIELSLVLTEIELLRDEIVERQKKMAELGKRAAYLRLSLSGQQALDFGYSE